MNKVSTYFRESYKELMEKVTWPTWTQLQQSTMIVLVATLVITGDGMGNGLCSVTVLEIHLFIF